MKPGEQLGSNPILIYIGQIGRIKKAIYKKYEKFKDFLCFHVFQEVLAQIFFRRSVPQKLCE